jgi:hypothetical protein
MRTDGQTGRHGEGYRRIFYNFIGNGPKTYKYSLVQNSGHTWNENARKYVFPYDFAFNYFSCLPSQMSLQAHTYVNTS